VDGLTEYAHGGVNSTKAWGGIPVVLLLGDDHQLPSVVAYGKGHGAGHIVTERGLHNPFLSVIQRSTGKMVFMQLPERVHILDNLHRIQTSATDLLDLTSGLRCTDEPGIAGLTDSQARLLMDLKKT